MFKEVITLAPDNFRGYSNLGAMYVPMGRYSEAIEACRNLSPSAPPVEVMTTWETPISHAEVSKGSAQLRRGVEVRENQLAQLGQSWRCLLPVPDKRQKANEAYSKAIRLADEELRVNPRDGRTWAFRATYLAMMDSKREALDIPAKGDIISTLRSRRAVPGGAGLQPFRR